MILLGVVSLVQVVFAALTYHNLQSKPIKQRIEAQLNATLRAASPIIDQRREQTRERLRELVKNVELRQALENNDPTLAALLIDRDSTVDDGSVSEETREGELPGAGSVLDEVPEAYITDSEGEVIVGTMPDAPMLERKKEQYLAFSRGSQLIATIHVPVVFDERLMKEIARFKEEGVTPFAVSEDQVSSEAEVGDRPKGLKPGVVNIDVNGTDYFALIRQPWEEVPLMMGARVKQSVVDQQQRASRGGLWTFIGLLVVLMGFLVFMVTRSVAAALRQFAVITRKMSKNQLNARLPVYGNDEIAVLSGSFNAMAENLEQRMRHLEEARARLGRQVELFGEAIVNANNAADMLVSVCTIAIESTSASRARFWTLNEDGEFEHVACIGLRPNDTEPCALERQSVVHGIPVFNQVAPYWLVVPARSQETIVGMLTLVNLERPFTDKEVLVAERLAVQAAFALDNARMHLQLQEQATRDGLTGLANHRLLQEKLSRQIEEAYDSRMPIGVALLDVDNFKKINDSYGHPVGDEALKAIASVLTHRVVGAGTAARYGGEEFVLVLPGCDSAASCRIAEHVRREIEDIKIPLESGGTLKLTASFGVANVDQNVAMVTKDQILNQADIALYRSKRTGKNRVELATPAVVAGTADVPPVVDVSETAHQQFVATHPSQHDQDVAA